MPTDFDALVSELAAEAEAGEAALAKAMPAADDKADDKKIMAAAEDGDDDKKKDGDEDEEGEEFGKSFTVKLDDGTEVEAFDGTQMMKALAAKNTRLEAELGKVGAGALAAVAKLSGALTAQAAKIGELTAFTKSLQDDLARIGGQGAGRKAVVNIHEKPGAGGAEAEPARLDPQAIMAKAMALQGQGAITSSAIARLEMSLQTGRGIPADLQTLVA